MQRITGATVSADLHGAGKDGFTEGVPGTTAATIITGDWLNGMQEEILTVIEAAAIVPSAGDNGQLEEAIQELVDSHTFTGNVVVTGDITYSAPSSVTKTIPTPRGIGISGTSTLVEVANGIAWQFSTNNAAAIWPIELPHGATIAGIVIVVNQGNAGASGQMSVELWRMENDYGGGVDTQIGTTTTFTAGAGYHTASVNPVSNNVISNPLNQYYVRVNASALAATVDDYLYGLYVVFLTSVLTNE